MEIINKRVMKKGISKRLIILSSTAVAGFLCFVALMILVLCDYSFKIDQFNVFVANNRNQFWTSFFKIFTHLGSFYVLAILSLISVILIWVLMKNKRMSAFYAVSFACVCILNLLLKLLIQRLRPEHLMIIEEHGYSFPSGHAMMTLCFFALASHFVMTVLKNKTLKIALVALFSVLTLLIGFSRIYLGVHYLSDILAGFLIAFVIVCALMIVYKTKLFKFLKDKES